MQKIAAALFVGAFVLTAGETVPAGEIFRLEIGRPIAGGTQAKNKAVLVTRPLCCDAATVRITATAEGILPDGSRRSIPLDVQPLDTPGVHSIGRQWPEGRWVVNLTGYCAERRMTASAVVPIGPAGINREKIQFGDRVATAAEVDAVLRHTAE